VSYGSICFKDLRRDSTPQITALWFHDLWYFIFIYIYIHIDDLPIKNGDVPVREPFNNQRLPKWVAFHPWSVALRPDAPQERDCWARETWCFLCWSKNWEVPKDETGWIMLWPVVTSLKWWFIYGDFPLNHLCSFIFRLVNYYNSAQRNIFMAKNEENYDNPWNRESDTPFSNTPIGLKLN